MADETGESLSKYIKLKLGMNLEKYAVLVQVPVSTLHDRWKSEQGRVSIVDRVFKLGVERLW